MLIGALVAGPLGCTDTYGECTEGDPSRFDNTYFDMRPDYVGNEVRVICFVGVVGLLLAGGPRARRCCGAEPAAAGRCVNCCCSHHMCTHVQAALDYNAGLVGALAGAIALRA